MDCLYGELGVSLCLSTETTLLYQLQFIIYQVFISFLNLSKMLMFLKYLGSLGALITKAPSPYFEYLVLGMVNQCSFAKCDGWQACINEGLSQGLSEISALTTAQSLSYVKWYSQRI